MPWSNTIAELLQQQGQQGAETARAIANIAANSALTRGKIISGAVSDIGNTLAAIPAQRQQAQEKAQESQLRGLQLQKITGELSDEQKKRQDAIAVQSIMQKHGDDLPGAIKEITSTVDPVLGLALNEHFTQANEAGLKFKAAQLDYGRKQHEFMDQVLTQATDQSGYTKARQSVIAAGLATPDQLPEDFNAAKPQLAALSQSLIPAKDRAELEQKKLDDAQKALEQHNADVRAAAAAAETARHNRENERIAGLNVGREAAAQAETARHNRATEAANNPLAALTGGAVGGASVPASAVQAEGPHGADFLKQLPPNVAGEVKAYAEGRRPFPAGFALKSPYFQSLIQMVGQYDPTFDAVNYNSRAKTRQDFTSGASAKTVNALNTAIGHLDQLSTVSDELGNFHEGSLGPLTGTANKLGNVLSRASGSPKVTNFQAVVKPVADELTRVWRQSGGAEADIKNRLDALSASNTPEQLHGAIAEIGHLLESKLGALETQYQQGMGTTDTTGMNVVTPASRALLNRLEQKASGAAPNRVGRFEIVGP